MSMMGSMMGQMMGQMPASQPSNPSSELPGFPGASHIYHIGAKGFFLDHSGIVEFSSEQRLQLQKIKDRSQLAQASFDKKIQQAEEDLWKLTASDRPDIKSIEAKVKTIETLRGEKRIGFIREVGDAASILTDEQRAILLGQETSDKSNGMEDM